MTPRWSVYDTYWRTAAERQYIFFKRLANTSPPWTVDVIFQQYKFCNTYRILDRGSQYLVKDVIYAHSYSEIDTLFRIFLFRLLNQPQTFAKLETIVEGITWNTFDFDTYAQALEEIKKQDGVMYGNAFILCANKAFGYEQKHLNHLALLHWVPWNKLVECKTMQALYVCLRTLPLIGQFMAYQIAIDMNYSEVFDFDENDFTVAGPGAIRGIRKCFEATGDKNDEYIIRYMVENQEKEFARLGLTFQSLFGRPMKCIDCQGWFCETDKYCRIAFPELTSNRVRMKSAFHQTPQSIDYFFPPKWSLSL